MKENIETTRRRLQNRRVDDVSKFDYILMDNYKAKQKKALEMDFRALKPK